MTLKLESDSSVSWQPREEHVQYLDYRDNHATKMLVKFKHNTWCWFREQGQCQDYWLVFSRACLNNPFWAKCFIHWHFLRDVLPCLILLFGCQCRWQPVEQFIIMPDDPITQAAIFTLGEVWAPNLTALWRPGLCFWTCFCPSFFSIDRCRNLCSSGPLTEQLILVLSNPCMKC